MPNNLADTSRQMVRQGEAGFLAFLFIALIILAYETFQFRTAPWDPLGMAFWPRVQLGILGIVLFAQTWHLGANSEAIRGGFLQGLGILLGCIGFVLGMYLLGIYICTPLFLVLFALLRRSGERQRNLIGACVASVLILFAVWVLFDVILGLRVLSFPIWIR